MTAPPFSFQHWPTGVVAAAACVALVAIAAKRRPAVPRATLVLAGFGAVLVALGAGGLVWLRPATRPIATFVDLSASTRTADFRGLNSIAKRQGQLIGDVATQLVAFGERVEPLPPFDKPFVQSFEGKRTVLPTSDAAAILLFSDGRFADAPRALAPVYVVIDPALERAKDAAVTSLEARGDAVTIGVRNTGDAPRALELHGVMPAGVVSVQPGSYTLVRELSPGAESISATFAPGDRWPENDSMRTWPAPAAAVQRWWIGPDGAKPPDASWLARSPAQLPTDIAAYLGTGVIVLDDVPADALDDVRRAALDRYVRELGGALIILGGEHAFAAGGYAGTTLDTLSPLASTPPEPTTHWVLLADASGSMNQVAGGGRTRWQYAADAVSGVVKQLPPADIASIGSFADDVRWWSRGKSVTETLNPLPPADVGPRGATNLEAALQAVAAAPVEAKLPTQLLVATDAQATIANVDQIAAQFKSSGITLHLLLIGDPAQATGLAALRSIITATGGTSRIERLPENWAAAIRELARAAEPSRIERTAATVRFLDPLASMPPVQVNPWNRTWRKSDATPLAETTVRDERVTMAARWNVGEGQVGAIAFRPGPNVIEATAKLLERPLRDPRFRVSVDQGSTFRVTIDAADGNTYLNGEHLTLEFTSVGAGGKPAAVLPIPQTAPGRYELATDARPGRIAHVRREGRQTLDTFALPDGYAPEFDAVGNDRAALAELARRTGGRLIEPGDTRRLELPFPRRAVPLAPWLATIGAALVCAGLVRWRVGT